MNDKLAPAKNPAVKIPAATEKVMFGEPVKAEPKRAVIFTPGKDNTYSQTGTGGITTKQVPDRPASKPDKAGKPQKKAAKKTPKKQKKKVLSAAQRSEVLVNDVITSFSERLITEANAKGGYLSMSDLEVLNTDFRKTAAELEVAFEKSFEDYIKEHEHKSWENSRRRPFDRMLVKTFSHLLEDGSLRIKRSNHVSRRMLPGFFTALNLMLGADVRDAYQGKCRAIIKLVGGQNDKSFIWDDFYENEDARAIVFDALVDIAGNFSDLKKRRKWFVDLVNSHLDRFPADLAEDAEIWSLSEQGFDEFFDALMSELRIAVSMEAGRSLITRRHNGETTENLVALMKKLAPNGRSS